MVTTFTPKTFARTINNLANMGTIVNQWDSGQIDTSGSFTYSVSAPGYLFKKFSLNTDISFNQLGTVTKEVYSDAALTTLIGTYTSLNGASVAFVDLTDQTLSTVYVKDSYSFNGNTQLNSISNNFSADPVPGPLPLLGAGAAFGFSRKLRNRIKASA